GWGGGGGVRGAGLGGGGGGGGRGGDVGREAAGGGVRLERAAVAHQERPADRPHRRIEGRLERDLRADSRRVAGRDGDAGERHAQSAFTFADSMTCFQRASSSFMKVAMRAGVPPTGSADRTARRCATSGERIAPSIAAESLSATAAGVPGGATIPTQVAETKPGSASDIAGTPGSEATRCSLHTATALSLPAFTCGSVTPRLSNMR